MQLRNVSVVLLALLLAAMAMVPYVSAEDNVRSTESILSMKYLSDTTMENKIDQRVPETITDYALVTVDPERFINDADFQKTIECTIDGKEYRIQLEPDTSIIAPAAKQFITTTDGIVETDLPKIKQYRGKIAGVKNGEAFFTVDDKVILARFIVGNESYFISQYAQTDDGIVIHKVYNAKNDLIRTNLPDGNDLMPFSSTGTDIKNKDPEISMERAGTLSSTNVGLLAVYDTQFKNTYPSPASEIASMMATTNSAFSPSYVGVNLQITSYNWDTTLTSTDRAILMNQLITSQRSSRDSTNSDLVFLFSGKDLDGDGIGYSGQYSYGIEEGSAYALAQMVDSGTTYTASSYQRPILIAHELGHNFGAMHQSLTPGMDGYPCYVPAYARAATWTSWFTTKYSAMWSPFQAGTSMSNEFSATDSGHGDLDHRNALRISLQKDTVATYQ